MPKSNVAQIRPESTPAEKPVYDRLVTEVATLECVLATLVAFDMCDAEKPSIGSAELVLRESIKRLHRLECAVEKLEDRAAAEVSNG